MSLSFMFSDQNFVCISLLSQVSCIPGQFQPPRFDHPINTCRGVQITSSLRIIQLWKYAPRTKYTTIRLLLIKLLLHMLPIIQCKQFCLIGQFISWTEFEKLNFVMRIALSDMRNGKLRFRFPNDQDNKF
jgi:hypothetical protein